MSASATTRVSSSLASRKLSGMATFPPHNTPKSVGGKSDEAGKILAELESQLDEQYVSPADIAMLNGHEVIEPAHRLFGQRSSETA